ncbi:peptidoglycan-binding protein [Shouchella clausii]|uniref:peptidoglycan-binding domain-containing protein n=1 Tax=Shouchella TaxID=2893057 RepID=UPI0004E7070B|nr:MULTISPECIES: peptidoglycan-binding protein [Shouchella]ALA51422.1 Peptidoglycan-binding domain 1 [Shouchella clausii]MBU3232825.1 peptidoglycan-binding protein [Shouchella clausii]MBU3265722.1 peptidoglycan-binding protein [Shouchella clausii]MBU3508449.1 peptidoglycan-binding protein [Shouchella clausii]MBU3535202.1 peptidoglycan-binding protein [Shouchella clausii]
MNIDNQIVDAEGRKRFIEMLQKQLIRENPSALPIYGVDGQFGSETRNWVNRFQERKGLKVDGIAGPETLGRLREDIVQRPDTSGSCVEILQEDLLWFFIQQSAIDGQYGPGTTQGVRDFQFLNNLVVDGVAGPNTLKKMDELITSILTQKGDSGSLVLRIQNQLNDQGEADISIEVDGEFGPETEEAVRVFQDATEQRVDGIAGPVTMNLLDLEALHPTSPETIQQFLLDNGIRISTASQNQDITQKLTDLLALDSAFKNNVPSGADNELSSVAVSLMTIEAVDEDKEVQLYHLTASLDEKNQYINVQAVFNLDEKLEQFAFIVIEGDLYESNARLMYYDEEGNLIDQLSDTLLELTNADLDVQKDITGVISGIQAQSAMHTFCDWTATLLPGTVCGLALAAFGTGIGAVVGSVVCGKIGGDIMYDEWECDQYIED